MSGQGGVAALVGRGARGVELTGIGTEVATGQRVARQGKEGALWRKPADTCTSAVAASGSGASYVSGVWHQGDPFSPSPPEPHGSPDSRKV